MRTVTLNVDDEVGALGDLVIQEAADIKAAKGIVVELTDAVPAVLSMATNYSKLGADVKSPDDIAYLARCLAQAFIPAAAPAPAAAV